MSGPVWWIGLGIVPALIACGRVRFDVVDDAAAIGDSPIDPDAAIDAGPSACQLAWLTGIPTLTPPVRLTGLSGAGVDRDPFLSPDGLTLYFSRDGASRRSSRADRTALFLTHTPVAELAGMLVTRVTIAEDGLEMFYASDTGTANMSDIWRASRADTLQPFTPQGRVSEVSSAVADFDPHLSKDGLRLYLAQSPTTGTEDAVVATRPTRQALFGAPVVLTELSTGMANGDPFVTGDERVILFSRFVIAGESSLMYARRDSASGPFTVVGGIPAVNVAATFTGDPVLSADSCVMVFSSTRGSTWDLYLTNVVP